MKTRIATSDATSITVRGRDLVQDLIGRHSFTEILYFLVSAACPNRPTRGCSMPAWSR
jgi:citrate synthase